MDVQDNKNLIKVCRKELNTSIQGIENDFQNINSAMLIRKIVIKIQKDYNDIYVQQVKIS